MYTKLDSMQISIFANKTILEVQEEFSKAYPFLKIEFFRNGEVRKDRYPSNMLLSRNLTLKEAWNRKKNESDLLIDDDMTVADLENAFLDNYGLSVQVFRKSGNVWLETTMTDNWTLKHQNDHGNEISATRRQEKE